MTESTKVNVGICGLGTVASGVVNVLRRNHDLIQARVGVDFSVAHIGARRDNPNCDTLGIKVSRDVFAVVQDPDVEVVVELIGGTTTAKDLVFAAIENGKHVVTANKALVATYGDEIFAAAAEKNVAVKFEAAVAGGIPVIKALAEGLAGNKISSISGIINGTGNYILTEMREKGRSFAEALADAQALGYAEADPTFDVEGIDAAQKLVILSALAFGVEFDADACFTEGIAQVTVADIKHAEAMGYSIKHLGIAKRLQDKLELRVHPCLVPKTQLIASVDGVMNAVAIESDAVGTSLYYGPGAGSEPTASAVIGDLTDLGRTLVGGSTVFSRPRIIEPIVLEDMANVETAWYLRVPVRDQLGVLSDITQTLSDEDISIQAMQQPDSAEGKAELILITSKVAQKNLKAALANIQALDIVTDEPSAIRVEA